MISEAEINKIKNKGIRNGIEKSIIDKCKSIEIRARMIATNVGDIYFFEKQHNSILSVLEDIKTLEEEFDKYGDIN